MKSEQEHGTSIIAQILTLYFIVLPRNVVKGKRIFTDSDEEKKWQNLFYNESECSAQKHGEKLQGRNGRLIYEPLRGHQVLHSFCVFVRPKTEKRQREVEA